jgi:putative transcriptional regulator
MSNHPNRGKTAARNPKPDEIRKAREAAGLTQTEAGALIYVSLTGWQKWEQGERAMHPAFWELFRTKVAQ